MQRGRGASWGLRPVKPGMLSGHELIGAALGSTACPLCRAAGAVAA